MTEASRKVIIDVSADAIWQVISNFGAASQYLVGVVSCTAAGEGPGARRTLTSADGSTIVERLVALDGAAHQLSYGLLTDTPFRNCLTTMALLSLDTGQTELIWSATFQPDGLPAREATALLEGALAANCHALKQFMEAC
jgi:hypothetical protein